MDPRSLRTICALVITAITAGMTLPTSISFAKNPPVTASEWNGEFFDQKQGGAYLKVQLGAFPSSNRSSPITGNVQIALYNILAETTYVLSYAQGPIDGAPRQLWKIPTGKYLVQQVLLVDGSGTKRVWLPGTTRHPVIIARQCVSNLGLWTIAPAGPSGLKVDFAMTANTYREESPASESSVAAIVDGFTGRVQQVLGGKKVITKAEEDFAEANEMRAVVRMTRQIGMFFKLDLFRYNAYAREVAAVLSAIDPNLRQCYIRALEQTPSAKGTMVFGFLLSRENGRMKKVNRTGGTLTDPTMIECLVQELSITQFPAKETMVGELTFTFESH